MRVLWNLGAITNAGLFWLAFVRADWLGMVLAIVSFVVCVYASERSPR